MSQFDDTREAVTTIAEKAGPEATGLLVACMQSSARHLEWVDEQIRGGLEADRDRWRVRALEAERHLAWVQTNVLGLIAPPTDWDPNGRGA